MRPKDVMTRHGNPRALLGIRALPVLALGAALACSSSPDPARNRGSEADLRASIAAYDSAWQAKDFARVDSLLASDYLYVSSTGQLSPRTQTLEFLLDPTYRLSQLERSELLINPADAMARVTSRWQGRGEYQGRPVLDDQTCGQIWVWREGRWQLFTEHCVNRPGVTEE